MTVYGVGTAASGSTTARDVWLLLFSPIPALIAWGRPGQGSNSKFAITRATVLLANIGHHSRLGEVIASNSEVHYYLSYYLDE